jgi:hypothetical protein
MRQDQRDARGIWIPGRRRQLAVLSITGSTRMDLLSIRRASKLDLLADDEIRAQSMVELPVGFQPSDWADSALGTFSKVRYCGRLYLLGNSAR